MSKPIKNQSPAAVLFRELPLGARFRYKPDSKDVWVVISRADYGTVAKWEGVKTHRLRQSVCSAEDSPEKAAALRVFPCDEGEP